MASNDALHVSFDDGFGPIGNAWNVDASVPGEVRLAGSSAMMEWATGRDAGHGYGTYTVNAKLEGNQPGAGIILWPGDNQWPGQELDMAEITPDGSGRVYGTVHWNAGGFDAYEARIFDGITTGSFHDYTMVWEPGRITFKVDGAEKGVVTENVPVDFAHGGMNNTIGFLNNNPNTSITVRDVSFTPLGEAAPAPSAAAPAAAETAWDVAVPAQNAIIATEAVAVQTGSGSGLDAWTDANGMVDWNALAAHVTSNYEATGQWFI
ncbi:family 16 glycosylhydrolase [Falsiroseomonas oryzae]|uniref:family 16 glycosylhydrolase n=1 Tax=Falsiroseomonas oryzae TaxID=2766473 RepID=UPI0022EA7B56|nr:family 16 glycosylhydrolase [Roseomonas sp. MO-31]